jgi:hypothetical protein
MTGRPSAATCSVATLFIATFMQPYVAPKTSRASPSCVADFASDGSSKVTDNSPHDATVSRRLPNRRQSMPATSMVVTAPTDMPSSASPSALADAPVCCLTAGTRTAQFAKMNPMTQKKAVNATRGAPRCVPAGCCDTLFSSCTK